MMPQPTPQQLDQMIQSFQSRLDAKVLERGSLMSLRGHSGMIADGIASLAVNRHVSFESVESFVGADPDRNGLKDALFNLWTAQIATLDIDIKEISFNLQVAKQAAAQQKSGILLAGTMPPNNRKV
jgi:hypothetical protein